jgi:molybdate transport system substrate-binding protein
MTQKAFIILLTLSVAFSAFAQQAELVVSAASSLTNVLSDTKSQAELFVGARMLFNFGGSGTLRKQIEEGAPVDVFFSAASEDMDVLQEKNMIAPETRVDLLSNALVLITNVPSTPVIGVEGLHDVFVRSDLLAIGNPDSVPAGRYAVQALKSLGLYDTLMQKFVFGGTVREVLAFVESGAAPLGIVFATDARSVKQGSQVRQIFVFPGSAIRTPILYSVAVVSSSKNRKFAEKLITFLQTVAEKDEFQKVGFVVR